MMRVVLWRGDERGTWGFGWGKHGWAGPQGISARGLGPSRSGSLSGREGAAESMGIFGVLYGACDGFMGDGSTVPGDGVEALASLEGSTRRLLGPLAGCSAERNGSDLLFLIVGRCVDDVALELPRVLLSEVMADEDELSGFHKCIQDESRRNVEEGKRSADEDLRCFGGLGVSGRNVGMESSGGGARCLPALTDWSGRD